MVFFFCLFFICIKITKKYTYSPRKKLKEHIHVFLKSVCKEQSYEMKVMQPPCSLRCIHNSWDWEAAQVPISRWVNKTAVVHLHDGILLGCKKEGNLTFCDSVDEPGEHYAKWNKAVRESQMPSSIQFHLYVKSNKQNKLTNKIETD